MPTLATYSPEDVTALIAGSIQLSGFVDGTFINITKDESLYASRESADGFITRVHRNSGLYTVTFTLMSTSPYNDVLATLASIDHLTQMGKFPLIIKDLRGSTLLFSTTAWIENLPDTDFSNEVTSRAWRIRCSQSTLHVGNNEEASSILADVARSVTGLIPTVI